MAFFPIYFEGLLWVLAFFSFVWIVSVFIKNASIVDIFWGVAYVVLSIFYFLNSGEPTPRKIIVLLMVILWGLRLSIYIFFRNKGKEEDFRYQEFRKRYGEHRYWWFSFFQVFLLQGVLVWIISAPLLAIQLSTKSTLSFLDYIGIGVWLVGFVFEAGGDYQMSKFKKNPRNKGKLMQSGFWKFTRHPNYFGDAAVWWGFAILSISSGTYLTVLGPALMTWLLLKVSGVAMLERTLVETKPGYKEYVQKTSAFIPWFTK